MKNVIVSGLVLGSLTAGCGAEQAVDKSQVAPEVIALITEREIVPYHPDFRGPKGGGDLGQAWRALELGEQVIADCVYRPAHVTDGRADSAVIVGGELDGWYAPLEVYPNVNGQIAEDPAPVFNVSPGDIRAEIGFCE